MNFKNRVRGKKAKVIGQTFEHILNMNARFNGIKCIIIPDGCKRVGPNPKDLVRVKTPYDFTLIYNGTSVFIDTKTFDQNTISFSMLTPHQVDMAVDIERAGCTAGYLIWFRKENAVCFARGSELSKIKPGSSMHGKDMIYLGTNEEFYLGRLFTLHLEDPNGSKRDDCDGSADNDISISSEGAF